MPRKRRRVFKQSTAPDYDRTADRPDFVSAFPTMTNPLMIHVTWKLMRNKQMLGHRIATISSSGKNSAHHITGVNMPRSQVR